MRGISWIIEGSLELENFSPNDYNRLANIFIKYINPDHKDFCFKFFQAACSVSNSKLHPCKQRLIDITFSSKGVISPFVLVHLFFIPFDKYLENLNKELGGNISFVRYADKFIVGVSGNHKDTIHIRVLLKTFFYEELGLNLKTNNTNVVHLGSQFAEFLGYHITTKSSSLKLIQDSFTANPGYAPATPDTSQEVKKMPRLIVNRKAIKEWLIFEGLANEDGKPRYVGRWLYLSDGEIKHCFNHTLTRLKAYYLEFSNRGQLYEAGYIIKYSFLHTLAAKHRMTLSKVLAKYVVDRVKLGAKLDKGKTITFSEL